MVRGINLLIKDLFGPVSATFDGNDGCDTTSTGYDVTTFGDGVTRAVGDFWAGKLDLPLFFGHPGSTFKICWPAI